ncbi:hypothetical protein V1J52_08485 [Streptomyces sp. TRM 70351]|uniref:glycine cleavage system protein H n=1 Tax=Streptomyces sp. TRM 70351 TaxID=3116552 RepID=UPI002E7B2573|nr:hypothetical protein [Streptomyces sp. TRM 70351]MEE1928229.1 hypothetical protein [Streptomyces sp. TRM 70351]
MHEVPEDRKYSDNHLWVQVTGDARVRVGVTGHPREPGGVAVRVALPGEGDAFEASEVFCTVEAAGSAPRALTLPMSGTVVAVNDRLAVSPADVDDSPFEDGWLAEIAVDKPGQLGGLLSPRAYAEQLRGAG